MNNTKPGLQWAKTETFLISSTCPHANQPRCICKTNRSTGNRDEWRGRGKKSGPNQLRPLPGRLMWTRLTVTLESRGWATATGWKAGYNRCSLLIPSILWSVEGLAMITSTDGAVAHVARLAGTQVSSDGVGADGVLIAQILAAGALVMLWGGQRGVSITSGANVTTKWPWGNIRTRELCS